jgi:MYXO-CTERM domain-containing protein
LAPTGPTEVVITNSTIGTGNPDTAGGFGFTFDVVNGYAGGYVYTRAFNTTTVPTIGNYYYQSPLSGPLGLTTSDPLTVNNVDPTPGGAHTYTNIEIIPEPVSAGLGLAGLAAIAWRRMRRRGD